MAPVVHPFFHPESFTYSYVIASAGEAIVLDAVLDYNGASGRVSTDSADAIIELVQAQGYRVQYVLETHPHADHLSGGSYIQARLGGKTGIGNAVGAVQNSFGDLFNLGPPFRRDGSQFDCLFEDDETFSLGELTVRVMHTPGHTPACVTYVIGDCAFVGDTLFMPDYGTARTDFPGGDAAQLYSSIRRILSLPDDTRMYLCHDYMAPGRDEYCGETSVGAQAAGNVHIHAGVTEAEFVSAREAKDAGLATPKLLLPALQFNIRGGHFPEPEANGMPYFKIPVRGGTELPI